MELGFACFTSGDNKMQITHPKLIATRGSLSRRRMGYVVLRLAPSFGKRIERFDEILWCPRLEDIFDCSSGLLDATLTLVAIVR